MHRPQLSRHICSPIGRVSLTTCLLSVVLGGGLGGCTNAFIDPTEMPVPYQRKPLMVNILKQLDTGYEEPNPEFAQATDVRPEDNIAPVGDYTIGPNDYLNVSITDLVGPQIESLKQLRVSESGMITLPLIGPIQAAGQTEAQLETAISQKYKDLRLIQNAQVTVTIIQAQSRTFSILGSVSRAGQYQILQSDFRLLDALVMAGDVNSTGIDSVYIVRRMDRNPPAQGGAGPGPATRPTDTDILTPRSRANSVTGDGYASASGVDKSGVDHRLSLMTRGQDAGMAQPVEPATQPTDAEGRTVTVEGREVQTGTTPPGMEPKPADEMPAPKFEFDAPEEPNNVRVLRVPFEELRTNGKMRYNVVIRPGDLIWIPPPVIGEYYMGGHIARVGVYSLTARKITLKMAVISAGMLDQVAIPQRTSIIRRVKGQDKEIFASVDLAKIFAGEEPDLYLKPDDQVMVGTVIWAPFVAAIRNGFRMTYGFGFLYDRNYFEADNN